MNFFLLLDTKENILKKVVHQSLVTHIIANVFCVQQTKEIHTGLEQLECPTLPKSKI